MNSSPLSSRRYRKECWGRWGGSTHASRGSSLTNVRQFFSGVLHSQGHQIDWMGSVPNSSIFITKWVRHRDWLQSQSPNSLSKRGNLTEIWSTGTLPALEYIFAQLSFLSPCCSPYPSPPLKCLASALLVAPWGSQAPHLLKTRSPPLRPPTLTQTPWFKPLSRVERAGRLLEEVNSFGPRSWKQLSLKVRWLPLLLDAVLKSLMPGLENYQPDDSRETRMLGRFPLRNKFISDWIYEKTGRRRTAKQVGSRLQQLRDTCHGGKKSMSSHS